MNTNFRLFDTRTQKPFNSVNYISFEQAMEDRDAALEDNDPMSTIAIHQYMGNDFVADLTNA